MKQKCQHVCLVVIDGSEISVTRFKNETKWNGAESQLDEREREWEWERERESFEKLLYLPLVGCHLSLNTVKQRQEIIIGFDDFSQTIDALFSFFLSFYLSFFLFYFCLSFIYSKIHYFLSFFLSLFISYIY